MCVAETSNCPLPSKKQTKTKVKDPECLWFQPNKILTVVYNVASWVDHVSTVALNGQTICLFEFLVDAIGKVIALGCNLQPHH